MNTTTVIMPINVAVKLSCVPERECKHCDRPESEHMTMKALASPGHFFERYDRRQEAR